MPALWMLVSALLFSAMGAFIKLASVQYTTAEILFYRSLMGLIIIWLYMYSRRESPRSIYWRMHLNRSFAGVLTMSLWFASFSLLPVATAMTFNYTSPIWMSCILIVNPLLRKQTVEIDIFLIFTILASFIGVVCLLQPTIANHQLLGSLLGLSSGIFAALAYLAVRQLGQYGESETRIVFYLSLTGVMVGGGWMLWSNTTPHTTEGVKLLLAVGVSATLAQLALTRAYRYGNTLLVANFHYMGIVFAAIWGALIWGDQYNTLSWVGMALIIISGVFATCLRMRRVRPTINIMNRTVQ